MNGYATIVLSRKALEKIYIEMKDLDAEDYEEVRLGAQNARDMEELDGNAVTTPLSLYK